MELILLSEPWNTKLSTVKIKTLTDFPLHESKNGTYAINIDCSIVMDSNGTPYTIAVLNELLLSVIVHL